MQELNENSTEINSFLFKLIVFFFVETTSYDTLLSAAATATPQTEPSTITTIAVKVSVPPGSDSSTKDEVVYEKKDEFCVMLNHCAETCEDEQLKIVTKQVLQCRKKASTLVQF